MAIHNIGGFNYQFGMEMPMYLAGEKQEFASDSDMRLYEKSRGVPVKLIQRTSEEKLEAQTLLEQALQMRIESRHAEGLECLKKSSALGNGQAMWELGCAYSADGDWGLNVNDQGECQKMFLLSAESGYPAGLAHASKVVAFGTDKPEKRIFSRLLLACMALSTNDPYAVGYCYQNGLGVQGDIERSLEQYKVAAIQGVAEAQIKVGKIQQEAWNPESAIAWYKKAAAQGRAYGQYHVGNSFYRGNGFATDSHAAFANFSRAALGNVRFGTLQLINMQYLLPSDVVDGAKKLVELSKYFATFKNFDGAEYTDFLECAVMKQQLITVWSQRIEENRKVLHDDHLREQYQLGKGLVELAPSEKTFYATDYARGVLEKVYHDSRLSAQKAVICALGLRSKRPRTLLGLLPRDLGTMLGKMIWAMRDNPAPWLQKDKGITQHVQSEP